MISVATVIRNVDTALANVVVPVDLPIEPEIANSSAAKYVIRYEQNPRPLDDYRDDDDRSGYDGVTVQWFESMDAYYAHMAEPDFPAMMEDIAKFLDTDRLEVVLTEEPRIVIDGAVDW